MGVVPNCTAIATPAHINTEIQTTTCVEKRILHFCRIHYTNTQIYEVYFEVYFSSGKMANCDLLTHQIKKGIYHNHVTGCHSKTMSRKYV